MSSEARRSATMRRFSHTWFGMQPWIGLTRSGRRHGDRRRHRIKSCSLPIRYGAIWFKTATSQRINVAYNTPRTGAAYIGTRPSRGSVRSVCRKISALREAPYGLLPAPEVVGRLNRVLLGWANYFCLGQASLADAAIDAHTSKRLRR